MEINSLENLYVDSGSCKGLIVPKMEACVAERLTSRTLDVEVRGSSLVRRVVSLDKELYSTLFLSTQVYKWVLATYCWREGGGGGGGGGR